jgi:hypothetical protein
MIKYTSLAVLEAMVKKYNINLDSSSSTSSSHGHVLSTSIFSLNASNSASTDERILDFIYSHHMAKDQAIFSTHNPCNTKQIFVGDKISLVVIGP